MGQSHLCGQGGETWGQLAPSPLPPETFSLCALPPCTHCPFRPLPPLPDDCRIPVGFPASALQPESALSHTCLAPFLSWSKSSATWQDPQGRCQLSRSVPVPQPQACVEPTPCAGRCSRGAGRAGSTRHTSLTSSHGCRTQVLVRGPLHTPYCSLCVACRAVPSVPFLPGRCLFTLRG